MNRQKRRAITRRQQREAGTKFHPRGLARSVAHRMLERDGATGVNKCAPGTTQSPFSVNWRRIADRFATEAK